MFVVIQKVQLKKPNTGGAYKKYKVTSATFYLTGGAPKTSYSYYPDYDSGCFERPHHEAYKISIHQSYRENGKVRTKQCVLGTIGYYVLADGFFGLYDYIESGANRAAKMFNCDTETIYTLTEAKVKPLQGKIKREYHKTEEYKTVRERDRVQKEYQKAKAAFAKQYFVDESEYDFCFNVFGEVMNQAYLDTIVKKAAAYSSYHAKDYSNYGYSGSSNFNQQNYSSYFNPKSSNYTEDEKQDLKKFYKALCLKFHPDLNPDKDTTKQMQLLNKLKEEWGI